MKKQFLMVLLAGLAVVQFGNAQEKKEEKKFGVKWNGYVNADYIFTSRKSITAREGQLMILPLPKIEGVDAKGNKIEDINAEPSFNSYAIESRLKASISGPDAFGMKTAGVIEAHFFGGPINTLGLRHAYLTLSNEKMEVLFGQFWHPNFVTNVSPGTIDFNAGFPFQSFNRSPQLRVSTKGNVRFIGTILTELDFKTKGGSVEYSSIPTLNLQLQFGDDAKFVGGAGINVKTVDMTPGTGVDTNNTSLSFLGYAKANLGGATWKLWGQYGGNTSELLNIGAYGLNKDGDVLDTNVLSSWTEFSGSVSNKVSWGVFAGYTMNNGFGEEAVITAHSNVGPGKINDIPYYVESAYRVSPRIVWSSGKVSFGVELDYTGTQYSNGLDKDKKTFSIKKDSSKDIESVGTFRTTFSAVYSF